MKNRCLPLVLALGLARSAAANNFESPEDAVRALEEEYVRRDADAAVAARDFTEEARRMLVRLGSGLDGEADILKQTAEVLELGYRTELKKSTFRRFKGVRCAITSVLPVEEKACKSARKLHFEVWESSRGNSLCREDCEWMARHYHSG